MTTGIAEKILKKLEILERKDGNLPNSLEFYRKLLSLQLADKQRLKIPTSGLSPEVVNERIVTGRPLFEFDDLSIDWSLFRDTFEKVNALLSNYSKDWVEIVGNIELSTSFLKEAARAWFEGTRFPFIKTFSDANEALWEIVVHATFSPFMVSYLETSRKLVNQELWRRGYCPICGGNPDFSFLDKERGARWLLCSRCDTEWLFQRLECPHCGTKNQNTLAYFTDDKGLYRLYICEQCHTYLKAIDLRQTDDEVLLPLERFLPFDLDTQAQKNGYNPLPRVNRSLEIEQGGVTQSDKGGKVQ